MGVSILWREREDWRGVSRIWRGEIGEGYIINTAVKLSEIITIAQQVKFHEILSNLYSRSRPNVMLSNFPAMCLIRKREREGERRGGGDLQRSFDIPEGLVTRHPGVARRHGGQHGVKLSVLGAVADEALHGDGDVDPRQFGIATQEPHLSPQNWLSHLLV